MPLIDLNTPEVRDLAWTIQSPGLLAASYRESPHGENDEDWVITDTWCEQQYAKFETWLGALDESPQPLLDWLKPRQNPRLGYYFESLVEFWLSHDQSVSRLIPHLQVNDATLKDQRRTLGEFDFLLLDSEHQRVQHWEVAVKFYLHDQRANGQALWYGPNPRDRLDLKLQRLFQHQLTLSRLPQARVALQALGLNLPLWPRLLLKGYLFYRSDDHWTHHETRFRGLSARHLRGWWTYLEPFVIPNAESDRRWLYLPRLQWLAPAKVVRDQEGQLMNFRELHNFCFDLLGRHQKPPLLAEMRRAESGVWEEVSRGFVVPPHWPGVTEKA